MLVVKLFTDAGYKQSSIVDDVVREPVLRSGHIVNQGQFDRAKKFIENGYSAIIPIRHPYLVAESWARRGKNLADMMTAYRRLPELLDLGAHPLPIDVEDREIYLNAIESRLNVKIATQWPIVNSKHGTHNLCWRDVNPCDEVEKFAGEIKDFLGRFYR